MNSVIIAGIFTILGASITAVTGFLTSFFENRRVKQRYVLEIKEELYEKIIQDYEAMIVKMVEYNSLQDGVKLLNYYKEEFIPSRMESTGKETIYLDKELTKLLNNTLLQIRKDISDKDRNAFIHSRESFDEVIEYIKKDIQKQI